ncbi:MAG: hypothetical protein A07HR60_02901 [uncultured archaeon A07HR60]|nr:MAG: hypothetical protein A07HR60_02901 [uncultured archaeon A07HR60]
MSGTVGFMKYGGRFWVVVGTELYPAPIRTAGPGIALADDIGGSRSPERRPVSVAQSVSP